MLVIVDVRNFYHSGATCNYVNMITNCTTFLFKEIIRGSISEGNTLTFSTKEITIFLSTGACSGKQKKEPFPVKLWLIIVDKHA